MKVLGIIPARMSASRFPNKPMVEILGIPMIGHCYHRTKRCSLFDDLWVATCDQEIVDYIESIGGKGIMTSNTHERPTERTAEAVKKIESLQHGNTYDIVVMVQGDEPLVDPKMLEEVIKPLLDGKNQVSNLMCKLTDEAEIESPNNVKVVIDAMGNAMYMSREPIPSKAKYKGPYHAFCQLGLIAFTRDALFKFINLPSSSLEIVESVDMNRLLENRIPVHMELTNFEIYSVDVPEDIERVQEKMKTDILFSQGY